MVLLKPSNESYTKNIVKIIVQINVHVRPVTSKHPYRIIINCSDETGSLCNCNVNEEQKRNNIFIII